MRIKRYEQGDLERLHSAEKKAGIDWRTAGMSVMEDLDRRLGSYWDQAKPEDSRAAEVASFCADHVVRRAFAKMEQKGDLECDELAALHKADWDVWKSGPMPAFGGKAESQAKLAAIYAKANR